MPGPGRPKRLTDTEIRGVFRIVKQNPMSSAVKIAENDRQNLGKSVRGQHNNGYYG